jgi:GntR family transcriptional regulator/MocR family aminotransferase
MVPDTDTQSLPMRGRPTPLTLVPIDPDDDAPLHRQLYDGFRDAILTGRLSPGGKIPSSRLLARELRLSRNTVALAFAQLHAEGYIEGQLRSGTYVSRTVPDALLRAQRRPADRAAASSRQAGLSARGRALAGTGLHSEGPAPDPPRPFRPGLPALDAFPRRLWTRLANRRWRGSDLPLAYNDPAGFRPLREAIAEHVAAARGAHCTAEQVIVVSGSQQALDLAARVLLDPGDAVWLEEPGYLGARAALVGAAARIVPVPLDREGLSVTEGVRDAPSARMVCVTPSHHYPTGVTMSAGRRLSLLQWAARADAWILEDDYDSDFRYASRPLACLQGMDAGGRVVYIGTFSKTLFPALRLGYLIVPLHVAGAFRAARAVCDRHSPTIDQAVLADFIGEGHFGRHVRRMRALYEERQVALVDAGRALEGLIDIRPAEAGLHLVGWLPPGVSDGPAAAALKGEGVEALAFSPHYIRSTERDALLLGYAAFDPRAIRRGVEKMATVLRRLSHRPQASV